MPPKTVVTRPIPSDVRTWDNATAQAALAQRLDAAVGTGGYEVNAAYMAGDHGQGGKQWRGVGYVGKTLAKKDWEVIEATQFVAVPEIEQCVWRRTNAACAKEAEFSLSAVEPAGPENEKGQRMHSDEQERFAAKWRADIGAWWSRERAVGVWEAVRQTTSNASAAGQACIRLFWNQRFRQTARGADGTERSGIPDQPSMPDALRAVDFVAPKPDMCGVYYDPDTLSPVGIHRYKTADDLDGLELWFLDGENTVFIHKEGDNSREYVFQWGGIIPVLPLSIPPLLTEPVRSLQAALDTTATSAMRLTISHGYAQRDEIDVRPSGEMKTEPPPGIDSPYYEDGPDGVRRYLWPSARELGNGVTNNLYGWMADVETRDAGGELVRRREYQKPEVKYHEPSDPQNVFRSKEEWKREIRQACHQGHIRDSGYTAEASGDAYEQARAEFKADAEGVASAVSRLTSGLLMATTVMAEEVRAGGDPASFVRDWTVVSQVHADPGPASSEKQRSASELMDKGALSRQTVQKVFGVQDTEVEDEVIAAESHAATLRSHFEAVKAARDAGVTNTAAVYRKLGYSETEAAELARSDNFLEEPPE